MHTCSYEVHVKCQEQIDYYIFSGIWTELRPEHVIGQPVVIKRLDLNTCTLEDCEGVDKQTFSMMTPFSVRVSGFAGWFTVDFAGSSVTPVVKRVTLSTGPEAGYTHWGQQVGNRLRSHSFARPNLNSFTWNWNCTRSGVLPEGSHRLHAQLGDLRGSADGPTREE